MRVLSLIIYLALEVALGTVVSFPALSEEVQLQPNRCSGLQTQECGHAEFCALTKATGVEGVCVPCVANCTTLGVPELVSACSISCGTGGGYNNLSSPAAVMPSDVILSNNPALSLEEDQVTVTRPRRGHRRLGATIKTTTGQCDLQDSVL